MGFKLKDFSQMIGIDKESSTYDTPVFKKELKSGGVLAEANNDGKVKTKRRQSNTRKFTWTR